MPRSPRSSNGNRCPCGSYGVQYAGNVGHVCSVGDPLVGLGLTACQVRYKEMLKLRSKGSTLREIGIRYGITYQAVQQFLAARLGLLDPDCRSYIAKRGAKRRLARETLR